MKIRNPQPSRASFKRTVASLVIAALFSNAAFALPGVGTFTKGAGTINTTGSNMTINVTGADNAVAAINWQGFNIANGENVHFNNAASAFNPLSVLNIDNSGLKSNINGGITSNGGVNATSVFLINPAGIAIGATANINVGGAFAAFAGRASTVSISDGSDLTLPNGVKVDVALNMANITVDPAAVVKAGGAMPTTFGNTSPMTISGSDAATLPFVVQAPGAAATNPLNLYTNIAPGTSFETHSGRVGEGTYVMRDGTQIYLNDTVVDGQATFQFGADASSALAVVNGVSTGNGSAVLNNVTVKSTTDGAAKLAFVNTSHEALSTGGTGYSTSVSVNGLTLDSSSGNVASLDTSAYSGATTFTTAPVTGVGNAANNQINSWFGRFMPTDSNRTLNASNVAVNLSNSSKLGMVNGNDGNNALSSTNSTALQLNLDSSSLFKLLLTLGPGETNDKVYDLGNFKIADSYSSNIIWSNSNFNNALNLSDLNIKSGNGGFKIDTFTGNIPTALSNSVINAGNQSLTLSGMFTVQDTTLTTTKNIAVTGTDFTNVTMSAGTGITAGSGLNTTFTNSTLSSTGGTIALTGGTNGNLTIQGTTVTNPNGIINTTGKDISVQSYWDPVNGTTLSAIDNGPWGTMNVTAYNSFWLSNDSTITTGRLNGNLQSSSVNANLTFNGVVNGDWLNVYGMGGGLGNGYLDAGRLNVNKFTASDFADIYAINSKAMLVTSAQGKGYIDLRTTSGDLTIQGIVKTTLTNDPYAVWLTAGQDVAANATGSGGNVVFQNPNPGSLVVGAGSNWAVFSGNPTGTNLGANTPTRKRYNNTYNDGDYFAQTYPGAEGNRVYYRNQPTLDISATPGQTKTYGDADPASFAYSASGGLQPGDTLASIGLTGSLDRAAGENAGSYLYGIGSLANDMGYVLNLTTGSFFTINPKSLLVSGITANNKVYDGTTAATLAGGVLTGVIGADDVTLSGGTGSFADKNVGNGKTVTINGFNLGGAQAGNYTLSSSSATTTANITPKDVNLSGAVIAGKVYDGNTSAVINTQASASGLIGGDAVSLNTSGVAANFSDKNVGIGKTVTINGYALSGADAGNYNLVSSGTTATADITAKSLSLAGATANNKTYDGTTAATLSSAGVLSGVVAGDAVNADSSSAVANFADKNAGTGKTVTISGITINGADAGNYVLNSSGATTTADISKKAITSSGASIADKTYDGSTNAAITGLGSTTGVIGGDVVNLAGGTATFADKNAGSNKVVSITGITLNGADAGNYSISGSDSATANIAQKTIAGVTGSAVADKTYDGTNAATITNLGNAAGLVAGDAVSLTATDATFSDKNAGTGKTVTVNGLALSGADAVNYNLAVSSVTTTANIDKKALTLSGTVAADKVYDGSVSATISNPGALSGVIAGDAVNVDTSGMSASFANKNVGSNKAISVSGLTINGADAANYTAPTSSSSTASITPKSITVNGVVAADKSYDATTLASLSGGVANGVILGDAVNVVLGSGSFADKNAGVGKTVTITGTGLAGADAGNYVASFQNSTTATINKAALTIAAVADTKVVDGSTSSSKTPVVTGLKAGDTATATQSFSGSSVGAQTISVSYSVNDGNGGNNYQVASFDAVGTINAAPVVPPVVVPPVVVPPVVQTPVVVRATRVEASNDVSTPTMRADTVLVPTGAGEAAMPSITQAPAVAAPVVVESTSAPVPTSTSGKTAVEEKKK